MDLGEVLRILSEILSNPLFVPLLVAFVTIFGNAYFLFWLRKWQYKAEYIISNVQKTYIPVVAEIHVILESLDRFLERPDQLKWNFETLEKVKKSDLFEFIRSHDKRLHGKLNLFYNEIRPKFYELYIFQDTTKQTIRADWTRHIENSISNEKGRQYSKIFVNGILTDHMFTQLLNDRTEEFPRIWNEKLKQLSASHDLFVTYKKAAPDKAMILPIGKIAAFDVSEDEIYKLIQISQPKLIELKNFYTQIKDTVDKEVVSGLIPMMQKYITNPLSS